MPCVLKRRDDGVFVAPIGRTITINVTSAQSARLVQLIYAGALDGTAPFQFTVKKGLQKLLVSAVGVTGAGTQLMQIVEVSGADVCPLRRFFWSTTHFHTTLDILGS